VKTYLPAKKRSGIGIASENGKTAILSRVLDPESEPMTPEAARYFLNVKFPHEDADRMNALAEKSRQGTLTENEHRMLENYCRVGDLLGILQSRARMYLKKRGIGG
jgi:hypothetical protein